MRKKIMKAAAVMASVLIYLLTGAPYAACAEKEFDTWDVSAASKFARGKTEKPYTIMVYMNGSDLESEGGAATDDLVEMLDSGLDASGAHLVVLTGGSSRWMNDVVPENECMLWEIEAGWFNEVTGIGPANMGNPGTLGSFLKFCVENYPARQYGLIMWDHGGGAIDGYGYDEKYIDGNLTLMDMKQAFQYAGLDKNKLSFLGFDTCLMATVEMAAVAADYAEVMIASEDLEPGGGWNYDFLTVFNENPYASGAEIGVRAVDEFVEFYGEDTDEILSLSVIDLSRVSPVLNTMGELMRPCSQSLIVNSRSSFRTLAGKRVRTKTFGEGSPRDNVCDMVDVGDMALQLSDMYPDEAEAVLAALDDCVIYNRHNAEVELCGLSAYYIYGGRDMGDDALSTYSSLPVSTDYTQYLINFYNAMNGARGKRSSTRGNVGERARADVPSSSSAARSGRKVKVVGVGRSGVRKKPEDGSLLKNDTPATTAASSPHISPEDIISVERVLWTPVENRAGVYRMAGLKDEWFEGDADLWPYFNGRPVCLFQISQTERSSHYAVPAKINGRDCDIIVVFSDENPDGLVEGARNCTGTIIQKGYDPVYPGDEIVLYSVELNEKNPWATKWTKLPEFKMGENALNLVWRAAPEGCQTGERVTDVFGEVEYRIVSH